jgi:O-acetyl-ADP-ribose deacetylase (regulator of RNase III)
LKKNDWDALRQLSLEVVIGDLVALPFRVGAVVNAANEDLVAGGGVCGAIFRAAGPGLQDACDKVAPCPTGEARITPAFKINADQIIHAVGPDYRDGSAAEKSLLASAYASALRLADDAGLDSIAFPAISTGIYGFPPEEAAPVVHAAIAAFKPKNLKRCLLLYRSGESAAPARAAAR